MFPIIESFTGKPIDREYAETRAKWERLYEVTQIKGDGETHPFLSPNDEFANFERWDKGNLDGTVAKKPEMLEFEYAARPLRTGSSSRRNSGSTPTSSAWSARPTRIRLWLRRGGNFWQDIEQRAERGRATHPFMKTDKATIMGWEQTASGYAACGRRRTRAN